MWKNFSQLLSLLFTFSDKFARHDKQIENLDRNVSRAQKSLPPPAPPAKDREN